MPGHLRVGLGDATPAADEHVLCRVHYTTDSHDPDSPCSWPLGLRHLAGPRCETWYVDSPVEDSAHAGFGVRDSRDWAWLGTEIPCDEDAVVALRTQELFSGLHQACQYIGKPHVARLWVVIPDIHAGEGDQERYKQFCLGRHQAYASQHLRSSEYPAATVVGGQRGRIRLHALAATTPGQTAENPRQTSAYHYPREYGPRSPSFSRAMRMSDCVLVSGTAAILGSQSRHATDTGAQLREIAENLDSLRIGTGYPTPAKLHYGRMYLRHVQDLEILNRTAAGLWPDSHRWPVLQADICRSELRCEIETVFTP